MAIGPAMSSAKSDVIAVPKMKLAAPKTSRLMSRLGGGEEAEPELADRGQRVVDDLPRDQQDEQRRARRREEGQALEDDVARVRAAPPEGRGADARGVTARAAKRGYDTRTRLRLFCAAFRTCFGSGANSSFGAYCWPLVTAQATKRRSCAAFGVRSGRITYV